MSRLREWSDGLGWHLGIAGALLGFALLAVLLTLVSTKDRLLWVGATVHGNESSGTVSYLWRGESYEIDVPGTATKTVTVYLDPSNPQQAEINSVGTRIWDMCAVGLPIVAAAGVIVRGVARRRRTQLRASDAEATFGTGLDPEFVQRQLEQLRRPPT